MQSYNASPSKSSFTVTIKVGTDGENVNAENVKTQLVGQDENDQDTPYSNKSYANLLAARWRAIASELIKAGFPQSQILPGSPMFGTREIQILWE